MEGDVQDLLRKNLELAKENNRLLKKMHRGAILGGLLKLVWLAIIIGVPVYLYLNYLAPIVEQVQEAAQTVQEAGQKAEGFQEKLQQQFGGTGLEELLKLFSREN